MSIFRGILSSYSLFGPRGVALVAKARVLGRSIEVPVSISGVEFPVYIRLRTTDVSLLSEMLHGAEYDLDLPSSPRVIVDAGANIGLTSIFYANKYPQARVLAIEPELSNFKMLKKNTALYANITCIRAALWKNDTTVTIADSGLGHWGFQAVEEKDSGQAGSCQVEAISVDSLMARFAVGYIDLLRVDIEGAEQEVFENASRWIDNVGVIAIELHDRLRAGCSRAFYLATASFQWEFHKGETVFLGKGERAVSGLLQSDEPIGFLASSPHRSAGRRRCDILSTV
jgi:FkbM family methyltransferase